jgi:SAM-dependent methyltransferase
MVQAYDAKAAEYDEQVEGDDWMRNVLWERYARRFRAGQTVLDVGCGTGLDAIFLAKRGIRVVGIDASPSMIAEANRKVAGAQLEGLTDLRALDLREIGSLPPACFDGIISAFASLSTTADLRGFAGSAARLLKPRGLLVVHLLNRTSLWEWLGLVRSRRLRAARRLGDDHVRTFMIGSRGVPHHLYHPAEAYDRFFAADFSLCRAYGIGIFRPPHTINRIPPLVVAALDRLERPLRPVHRLRDWGRFFVLELEKR